MDIKLTEKCFKGMYGAYAAMFTPYDKKGRVDGEMIARIIDYGLAGGLKGFYLTGTTGEWWLLSVDERKQLMDVAVKAMRGRGKLIAHVGANNTDDSVALAKYNGAQMTDADAEEAVSVGLDQPGEFVLYIRADEVVDTPKTITLKADGYGEIVITIAVAAPDVD